MNYKNSPKYVCSECGGENEIKEDVFDVEKNRKTCNYCKKRRLCIDIKSLALAVNIEYRSRHYEPCGSGGNSPSDIIYEILTLNETAGDLSDDLVQILSSQERIYDPHDTVFIYEEGETYVSLSERNSPPNDGSEHKELWDDICNIIKHRTRFFNHKLLEWLDDIFLDISKFKYKGTLSSPVYPMSPSGSGFFFYRARLAKDAEERIKFCCHPTQELAAPPAHLAKNGRMNPVGVSVFYAAFEEDTCIAELRLPVGEIAISGKFCLEQEITVFDLTVFDEVDDQQEPKGSVEDEFDYDLYKDRIAFLHKFSAEISKPISPDKETLEYMPTQALIEYLAHYYKPKIDAVIYASTQVGGKAKNIVFLNRTAKIIKGIEPKNGQYNARWGNGSYDIEFEQASKIERIHIGQGGRVFHTPVFSRQWDERVNITFVTNEDYVEDEYLSFVRGSLRVHKIKAVEYKTERFNVNVVNK